MSGELKNIGLILTLIDGILAIIVGVFAIIGEGLDLAGTVGVPVGTGIGGGFGLDALIGGIVLIVIGVIFVMFFTRRLKVDSEVILGIVIIVLAVIFTTWIGIIGGILVLIEGLT